MASIAGQNPYRPGFNQAPGVLVGRDDVLDAAAEALDVAALDGRTPRPLILVGSRGVGKTVLLGEIAEVAAERHGWLTIPVEVRPRGTFVAQLIERIGAARELLEATSAGARFEVQGIRARLGAFGIGGEVDVVRSTPASPPAELALERALAGISQVAVARTSGLVVTVDELHLAQRDELGDLAATAQQLVPDNVPLVVVLAGLPTIRDPGRSVTYLERAEWHELGLLDFDDAALALTGPAASAGRPLTEEAATVLAHASGGYPFAVQLFGHHAWRASSGATTITADHARAAIPRADVELADSLYASRWEDASDKEQEYLAAVAELSIRGGSVTGGEVAEHLGMAPKELSYLRDRLLKKGTVVANGRRLRFPVPGMAAWITRSGGG